MYLKLNWFEETWRREVLEATNARGVRFTEITLVSHLPPLPVAILDCFLAKRPGVFPLDMRNVMNVALFASCYCGFYVVLTLMNYKLVGRYPYPFMRALKRPWHWLASSWVIGVGEPRDPAADVRAARGEPDAQVFLISGTLCSSPSLLSLTSLPPPWCKASMSR